MPPSAYAVPDPYKSSRKIIPPPKRRHRVANPPSGPSPDRSQSSSRPLSQPGPSSQVSQVSRSPALETPPNDRDADGEGTGKLSHSDNDPYYVPRLSPWGNKMRARCVDELVIGPPIYCGTSDVPEDYWAHGMVPGISRQMRFPVLCSIYDPEREGAVDLFHKEMFLMSSSNHLAEYQGIFVPRIVAAQVVEPARLAIIREPLGADGWNFAHKSLKTEMKDRIIRLYSNLHERGILHGSPSLTNIWLPRPKPVDDPRDPSFYICNWSRARCVNPRSKRPNGGFEPVAPFIPVYMEQETFWEMRELKFNLDYNRAREAELKRFAQDFASLLSAAELRKARIDTQQQEHDTANTPESGRGIRHSLGRLFKKLVDIPVGPQVHELRDPSTGEIRIVDNRLDWLWTEREAKELIHMFSMSVHNARKSRNGQALRVAETVAEAAKNHLEEHRLSNMSDRQLTVMPTEFLQDCAMRWYDWDPFFPDRDSEKVRQKASDNVYESDMAQAMLYKHDMIQHDDYRGRSQQNAFGLPGKFHSMSADQVDPPHPVDESPEMHDIDSDPELGDQGDKTRGTRHFFSDDEPTPGPGTRASTPMPSPYMSSGSLATLPGHRHRGVEDPHSLPARNVTFSAHVSTSTVAHGPSPSIGSTLKSTKLDPSLSTTGSSETLEQKKQRLKYLEEALMFQAREVEKVAAVGEAVAAFSNPEEAFEELDAFIEGHGPYGEGTWHDQPGTEPHFSQNDNVSVAPLAPSVPIISFSKPRQSSVPSMAGSSPKALLFGLNLEGLPSLHSRLVSPPRSPSAVRLPCPSSPEASTLRSETGREIQDTKLAVQAETSGQGRETAIANPGLGLSRSASPTGSTSSDSTAIGSPVTPDASRDAQKPALEAEHWDAGPVVTPCSTNPSPVNHANRGMARGFLPNSTPTEDVFTHMDWEGSDSSYSRDAPRWTLDDEPPRPIASDGKTYYYPLLSDRGYCLRDRKSAAVGRSDVEGFQLPLRDAVRAVFQCILNAREIDPECHSNLLNTDGPAPRSNEDTATVVDVPQGSLSNVPGVDYTMWDESFPNRVPILNEDGTLADAELSFDPISPPVEIDDEWEAACQRDIVNRRNGLILNQRVIRLMLWMAAKREARDVAFYKGMPTAVLSRQASEVVRYSRAHVKPYDKDESDFQREKRRLEKEILKFEAISRVLKDEADREIACSRSITKNESVDIPTSAPQFKPPVASSTPSSLRDPIAATTMTTPTPTPMTSSALLPPGEQTKSPSYALDPSSPFHGFSSSHPSSQTAPVRPPASPVANPFAAFGKASSAPTFGAPLSSTSQPWPLFNSTTAFAACHHQQRNPFTVDPSTSWLSKFDMRMPPSRNYHHAKFYIENNVIIRAADVGEVVEEIEVEHIVREDFDVEEGSDDVIAYETPEPGSSSYSPIKRAWDESDDEGGDGTPNDLKLARRAKRYRSARRQM